MIIVHCHLKHIIVNSSYPFIEITSRRQNNQKGKKRNNTSDSFTYVKTCYQSKALHPITLPYPSYTVTKSVSSILN